MKATFMYGAGDVRIETVADPTIQQPTDAIVRITRACICGSDLHPYHSMESTSDGAPMGHEFIGVVEETGSDVTTVSKGDFVVAPFAFQDNTCVFCREGFHTACVHGGWYGAGGVGGAQAEAIRVPLADGSLVKGSRGGGREHVPVLVGAVGCVSHRLSRRPHGPCGSGKDGDRYR